jgi:hypothetical protein
MLPFQETLRSFGACQQIETGGSKNISCLTARMPAHSKLFLLKHNSDRLP